MQQLKPGKPTEEFTISMSEEMYSRFQKSMNKHGLKKAAMARKVWNWFKQQKKTNPEYSLLEESEAFYSGPLTVEFTVSMDAPNYKRFNAEARRCGLKRAAFFRRMYYAFLSEMESGIKPRPPDPLQKEMAVY